MRQRSRELVAEGETVYPRQLGELLDEANALAARGVPGTGAAVNPINADSCGSNRFAAGLLDWISTDLEEMAVDTARWSERRVERRAPAPPASSAAWPRCSRAA